MADCVLIDRCGFFAKYKETLDLACRGFTNAYCRGEKQVDCARLKYRNEHGAPPDDDMLPTGQIMPRHLGGRG